MDQQADELNTASIPKLWDFDNPAASAERFEHFAQRAMDAGDEYLAALARTQLARAFGLGRMYDRGFALIDSVKNAYPNATGELAVRIALEHGRLLNSSGKKAESVPQFIEAWEAARESGLDGLAVDAAHMLGIVLDGLDGMDWNEKALALAISSDQPAANKWIGSLLNNMGWSYHEAGNYQRAMELFEQALAFRVEEGKPSLIRIARWSVGRCYRSLGKLDVALSIQRSLETNPQADGYVFEEIAECLHAQGHIDQAKPNFAKAYEMLSQDPWLVANESDRLNRLNELSE
ncbi:MAG: tetratricopeptide repeat protein [Phycisphaerales bacterium]